MSRLAAEDSSLLHRNNSDLHSVSLADTASEDVLPQKICRSASVSLKDRIGRRQEKDGKEAWISQSQWEEEQSKRNAEANKLKFAFKLDDSEAKQKIIINSGNLLTVVRHVVPQHLLKAFDDGVAIEAPFAQLFNSVDDMRKHTSSCETLEDINALEHFLYQYQPQYKSFKDALYAGHAALVSFETLWVVFKAGDLFVATDKFEEKRLFKFTHSEEKIENPRSGREQLRVHGWFIGWDREQRGFTQRSCAFHIDRFLGYRNVRSLPVYPLRCAGEETRKALIEDLEQRGRKWEQLASNAPCCLFYEGTTIGPRHFRNSDSERDNHLSGRVIIDHSKESSISAMFETDMVLKQWEIIEEKLSDTQNGTLKALTEAEHFMLCPSNLSCFHIHSGKCYDINVRKLKQTEWSENAMDSLIIEEGDKDKLKRLIRNYIGERVKGADIIRNKGKGLTIILYGPSGVGKTLTAECVAEYAQTPLIPLSVGNLVADEDSIEDRLSEAFDNATRMKAILLLDEADVVLEARSFEDVRRNGIVSIFLRQLEYYEGILFLTTNRITSMDPAFMSRIQMALPYEELGRDQRVQIWGSLVNTVLVNVADADKKIIESELRRLSETPLNGRQIRNTLNLAVLLALDDYSTGGKVQLKHVRNAMTEAQRFQEFFEDAKKNHTNKSRVWRPFVPS